MRYFIILILMPIIQLSLRKVLPLMIPTSLGYWSTYLSVLIKQFCSICLPVLVFYPKEKYFTREDCSIKHWTQIFRYILLGMCIQMIGITLNLPISVFLQKLGYSLPASLPSPATFLEFTVKTVAVCLGPAIFEEVLFRRVIYNRIAARSQRSAIFFSGLFFAMAHFDFYNFMATFFMGITLGILRSRGISLLLCCVIHFTMNFTANLLNLGFENKIFSELFNRYFLLSAFFCLILYFALLPKKETTGEVIPAENIPIQRPGFIGKLLKNPLFYIYCVVFCIIGVNQL